MMNGEVSERIKSIEGRLDTLEKMLKTMSGSPARNPPLSIDMSDLLALPSSLQKTMLALQELKDATSSEVAEKTGRDRTVETIYLNQLMRIGHLNKERRGRKVYFKVIKYY